MGGEDRGRAGGENGGKGLGVVTGPEGTVAKDEQRRGL